MANEPNDLVIRILERIQSNMRGLQQDAGSHDSTSASTASMPSSASNDREAAIVRC